MNRLFKTIGMVATVSLLLSAPVAAIKMKTVRADDVYIQDTSNFPDYSFQRYIHENFDANKDWYLSDDERNSVTSIYMEGALVSSLTGIELFPNLVELTCTFSELTSLDLTKCPNLKKVNCGFNELASLDLNNSTSLTELYCHANKLQKLDVSACTGLKTLVCNDNQLDTLDLSGLSELETVKCQENKLTALSVNGCTALQSLDCQYNELTKLDITACNTLKTLKCNNSKLATLSIDGCAETLETLHCQENQLTKLYLRGFTALKELFCFNNQLDTLALDECTALEHFSCYNNLLTGLNVSGFTSLKTLYCNQNKLTKLNISDCQSLQDLYCYGNNLSYVDVSTSPVLEKIINNGEEYTTDYDGLNCLEYVSEDDGIIVVDSATALVGNTIIDSSTFPDPGFREYISNNRDANHDGVLSCSEKTGAFGFTFSDNGFEDLTGIEYFINLQVMDCRNLNLTSLDLSKNTKLNQVYCLNNQLKKLNVSGCTSLRYLVCNDNQLSNLDVSGCPELKMLKCSHNSLKNLDISGCTLLEHLQCYGNKIASIDVGKCPKLLDKINTLQKESVVKDNLDCIAYHNGDLDDVSIFIDAATTLTSGISIENNFPDEKFRAYVLQFDTNQDGSFDSSERKAVKAIDVHGLEISDLTGIELFAELEELDCRNNSLTTMDLSANTELKKLYCYGNNISKLSIEKCIDLLTEYKKCIKFTVNDTDSGISYFEFKTDNNAPCLKTDLMTEIVPSVLIPTPTNTPTPKPEWVTDVTVEIGKTYKYPVSDYSDYSESDVNWSVGNTTVATVNSAGTVTGKSFGNTYLYAGLPDGTKIKCLVRVVYPTLKINYTEKTLYINQTFTFTTSGAAGQKITWSVGNTSVATVNANGTVTGKSAANTYLYAKSADGRVAKCLLKIITPGTLGINYTEKTVYLGQSFTFTAKNVGFLTPTWSVGNTAVAKVDSNGKVTSVSVGNTYLYVKTSDGRSARCLVKVVDPGPLNIRYTEKTIKVGASFQFTAKNPAGQTVSWRVGNTSVATVDANGVVTGKSVGNTWLYAKTPDGREVKCLIKVVA